MAARRRRGGKSSTGCQSPARSCVVIGGPHLEENIMRFEITVPAESAIFPIVGAALREIGHKWVSEHQAYYGAPHGARLVENPWQPGTRTWLGYTAQPNYEVENTGWARWLACSGNWWEIAWETGSVRLRYDGRRHGQVRFPRWLLVLATAHGSAATETTEPGWPIWSTGDTVAVDLASGDTELSLAENPNVYVDWLEEFRPPHEACDMQRYLDTPAPCCGQVWPRHCGQCMTDRRERLCRCGRGSADRSVQAGWDREADSWRYQWLCGECATEREQVTC